MKHIGLFGGTFNPIHIGHLTLAINVYNSFKMNEYIFIPSKIPPHKNLGLTLPEKRYEMVLIAISNFSGNFKVSDIELKTRGISYTYKTLKYFRELYREDILSFVCGSDIFATIGHWQDWQHLFDFANFIIVNRKEMPFEFMMSKIPPTLRSNIIDLVDFNYEKYGKIILYHMDEIEISSTDIRNKFKNREIKKYLTKGVYEYINENNLYKEV